MYDSVGNLHVPIPFKGHKNSHPPLGARQRMNCICGLQQEALQNGLCTLHALYITSAWFRKYCSNHSIFPTNRSGSADVTTSPSVSILIVFPCACVPLGIIYEVEDSHCASKRPTVLLLIDIGANSAEVGPLSLILAMRDSRYKVCVTAACH